MTKKDKPKKKNAPADEVREVNAMIDKYMDAMTFLEDK